MYREAYLLYKRIKLEERIVQEAQWIIDNHHYSVRGLAKEFTISKSQIHRDFQKLKHIDDDLYVQVKNILRKHKKY